MRVTCLCYLENVTGQLCVLHSSHTQVLAALPIYCTLRILWDFVLIFQAQTSTPLGPLLLLWTASPTTEDSAQWPCLLGLCNKAHNSPVSSQKPALCQHFRKSEKTVFFNHYDLRLFWRGFPVN